MRGQRIHTQRAPATPQTPLDPHTELSRGRFPLWGDVSRYGGTTPGVELWGGGDYPMGGPHSPEAWPIYMCVCVCVSDSGEGLGCGCLELHRHPRTPFVAEHFPWLNMYRIYWNMAAHIAEDSWTLSKSQTQSP